VEANYHVPRVVDAEAEDQIGTALERLVRDGARRMLERALTAEVDEFLGRQRYARGGDLRGYRNGHERPRQVAVGTWSVPVRAPRVSDVPVGTPGFESEILPKRQRLSDETQKLFAQLYLEGLSSGDFEPVFRQLLGENAPLSPNTILRLKEEWAQEYEIWRQRPLDHDRCLYLWADGIYLGAGLEKEKSCLLSLLGARSDGTKELLAMEIGYRESKDSWAEVLRSLRDRGLRQPWSSSATASSQIYEVYQVPTRQECESRRDALADWLRTENQPAAAETLRRDWDDFVTFYDFPSEHWLHLRTSNPIESVFAGVRLRTDVAKRARNRDNALYLVLKVVQRLGRNWRALNGGPNLMQLVLAGAVFKDGRLQQWPDQPQQKEVTAA
jgi:putative transposase